MVRKGGAHGAAALGSRGFVGGAQEVHGKGHDLQAVASRIGAGSRGG